MHCYPGSSVVQTLEHWDFESFLSLTTIYVDVKFIVIFNYLRWTVRKKVCEQLNRLWLTKKISLQSGFIRSLAKTAKISGLSASLSQHRSQATFFVCAHTHLPLVSTLYGLLDLDLVCGSLNPKTSKQNRMNTSEGICLEQKIYIFTNKYGHLIMILV